MPDNGTDTSVKAFIKGIVVLGAVIDGSKSMLLPLNNLTACFLISVRNYLDGCPASSQYSWRIEPLYR